MPSGAMRKGLGDDRHWHFGIGWVNLLFIVFLFYRLIQLKLCVYIVYIMGEAGASALAVGNNE